MLTVKRILNSPVNSNCYIVNSDSSLYALIIDPGSKDVSKILTYLESNKLLPNYIILTHEHFDHIWGTDQIRQIYGSKVVATDACSEAITNPKKNLSIFYDQVGFSIKISDIPIADEKAEMNWNGYKVILIKSPGHTLGSMCLLIGGFIFTGDTILMDNKIITKLPGGSANKLKESIEILLSFRKDIKMIYPGHGESFMGSELIQKILV